MTLALGNITLDCDDPRALSSFWAAAMGLEVDDGGNEFFASIGVGDDAVSPNWLFIKVPEGKTAKNRMHLDLSATSPATEVARLVALGATHVADKAEWGHAWSVMADPEGNEFCVADH